MIKGYKKIKDVEQGAFIRTKNGVYAVVSEYRTFNGGNNGYFDAYMVGSGEALHIDKEAWVAIVDLEFVEGYMSEELVYPQ